MIIFLMSPNEVAFPISNWTYVRTLPTRDVERSLFDRPLRVAVPFERLFERTQA